MRVVALLLSRSLLPRKENILSYALWISTAGVVLGITLVVLVLAVMTGFQTMLAKNYTRISSEVVVLPSRRQILQDGFEKKILAVMGVEAVTPFEFGQAMVLKPGAGAFAQGGVTLEGVDTESTQKVTPWKDVWVSEPLWDVQKENDRWIWVGSQLAKKIGVKPGDKVNVLVAEDGKRKLLPFTVTAITRFGIYEHDLRYAMVDLKLLRYLFDREGFEPMFKVKLQEGFSAPAVRDALDRSLGEEVTSKLWSEINQNVFVAVEHQKGSLFLMLQIIVALAAVNVMNLLVMTTNNRRRDIAILRAMGMRFRNVFVYFVAQGAVVGILGIGIGIGVGYLCCKLAEIFQPVLLSEEIYNLTRLPFEVRQSDLALIAASGVVLCLIFSIFPALRAALERPVRVLRYE